MKKTILLIAGILALNLSVFAQKEYKIAKSSGHLNLNISGGIIEGYDGNEIIFTGKESENKKVDERAKGLVVISGSGYSDNTGLGLSVVVKGDDVNVNAISKNLRWDEIVTIKVPKNLKITFTNNSSMTYSTVIFKNLANEIEVSTKYNKIKLENNVGPMNVKSVYGSIDASFNQSIKGPISIISVYDYVDVSLPVSTKANLNLSTSYGKLYAAKEFKIDMDNVEQTVNKAKNNSLTTTTSTTTSSSTSGKTNSTITINGENVFTGDTMDGTKIIYSGYRNGETINGKINGGGTDIIIKSNYQNVYLRQK